MGVSCSSPHCEVTADVQDILEQGVTLDDGIRSVGTGKVLMYLLDIARGEGFGSSRVGCRLATNNLVVHQPKMRQSASGNSHLNVPNRNSLTTTASEPSGTMRLLPQRRVQKGVFRKG